MSEPTAETTPDEPVEQAEPETGEQPTVEGRRHFGLGLLALVTQGVPALFGWVMAGEGSNKAWRALGLLVGGIALVRAVRMWPLPGALLLAALLLAVAVGAWRLAPVVAIEPDEEPEQPGEEPAPHPAEALTRDELADLLRGLLQPKGGVHLKALASALPGPPLPTRDVRSLLARHGVRVRDGVRVPGVGGREGVHRDDIPARPSPTSETPSRPVVAAGQSNNNNAGEGLIVERGEGMTIIRDPADTERRRGAVTRT